MSKTPFLKQIALELTRQYGADLANVTLVFPNRRAGLFFRKYLAEGLSKPVWSPAILSMEDFVGQFSRLQVADKFNLVVELYKVYHQYLKSEESFDRFFYWGEMLLADLDDLDKYLISAKYLFTDLSKQKELDDYFDYLTPEQRQIIIEFWGTFSEQPSQEKRTFQELWSKLSDIYTLFTDNLLAKNLAYTGLIYREVAANLPAVEKSKVVVFAGFNALTSSEEKIITHFVKEGAQLYWDTDQHYMDDPHQEAGHFLRSYRSKAVFEKSLKPPYPANFCNNTQPVHVHAVAQQAGQVKLMGHLLEMMLKEGSLIPEKTAIVLPNEHLLFPVLNALPEAIKKVNITMGFPLSGTAMYSLLFHLLQMQQSAQGQGENVTFFFKHVLHVLKNAHVAKMLGDRANVAIGQIEEKNWVSVKVNRLGIGQEYVDLLFRRVESTHAAIDYLQTMLGKLATAPDVSELDREYAYHFFTQLNRVKEVIEQFHLTVDLESFSRLFKQLVQSVRLPFTGEPLNGLQIMGVLETRNLDFDNVFILSMNEGVFPASGKGHSFVPYNLRKAYGLPTFDQHDAIYGYLFYRLLQKAGNVHLFYNTEPGETGGGEMSRYVQQLIHENKRPVEHVTHSNPLLVQKRKPIIIQKSDIVFKQLGNYLVSQDGTKRYTPSALNMYLDCRLRFYFRYVAEIYEYDDMQDKVDPMVFGNLLHHAVEMLYARFETNKEISKEDIGVLKPDVNAMVRSAFAKHYNEPESELVIEGEKLLAFEMVKKYVNQIIEVDKKYAPFKILGLEAKEYTIDLTIEGDTSQHVVGLKGIIDRIDRKGEKVRVIDYKTGADDRKFTSIELLFDRETDKRNKAAMQTLYYALLYTKNAEPHGVVVPGVYNTKETFSNDFDYRLMIGEGRGKEAILDARGYLPEFEGYLQDLLAEIYSPYISFDQTSDEDKCKSCPYNSICNR